MSFELSSLRDISTFLPFHLFCYPFEFPQTPFLSPACSCPWVYPSSTLCRGSSFTPGAGACGRWPQFSDPGVWSLSTEWVAHSALSYRIPDFLQVVCTQLADLYPRKRKPFGQGFGFFRGLKAFSCSWSLSSPRWSRQGLVPGSGPKLGSTVPSPETSRRTPRTYATNWTSLVPTSLWLWEESQRPSESTGVWILP